MTELMLQPPFDVAWKHRDAFAEANRLQGTVYRAKEGRKTLSFTLDGQPFFLKYHAGVGWGEIFKNLLQLRLPVLGASREYEAALRLQALGIDTLTPVAFGKRGLNPARQHSFLITRALQHCTSLEDLCKTWPDSPPDHRFKTAILHKLADVSRVMHDKGINHRDYYLCHFLLEQNAAAKIAAGENFHCYLIDLHRAGHYRQLPTRWQVKDLSGLLYSSMDAGFSARDYLRFLRRYRQQPLKTVLDTEADFWRQVVSKANALYRKDFRREPPALFCQWQQQLAGRKAGSTA